MRKQRIAVVMGGPSAEHEISLKTGFQVVANLDRNKYDVSAVVASREMMFYIARNTLGISQSDIENFQSSPFFKGEFKPCSSMLIWDNVDIAFLALHGEFGEDGTIQGYLRTLGIRYTGCGVLSSAIGMHKILAKKVFEASGIPTPNYSVYRQGGSEFDIKKIVAKHKFPVFVKAPQSGSSKLMGRADTELQLRNLLNELSEECKSVLVETAITGGDEFSCPVIEKGGVPTALLPIYIKPKNKDGYFDYNAKYLGESDEICPPPPPFNKKETIELIQRTAVAVHTALECDSYSRTDIILKDNTAFVLEINTLPGMTAASLLPMAYAAEGGNFSELLDLIIANTAVKL